MQHVHYYNQKRQDWSATVAAAQRELQEHIQKRDALQQQAEQVIYAVAHFIFLAAALRRPAVVQLSFLN